MQVGEKRYRETFGRHYEEFTIASYYRDAMLMCIGEGTNEILRTVSARQLVDRYRI